MRGRRRKGLWIFFIFLVLIAGAGFLGYNLLTVEFVEVTGNEKFEEEYIINISGVPVGENIFKADLNRIKENVETNPYLFVNSVDRLLPSTIRIDVMEKQPAVIILYSGANVVLDGEGYILEIGDAGGAMDYPVATGLNVTGLKLGEKLKINDDYKLTVMYGILRGLEENGMAGTISEIDLFNPVSIKLISKSGILIKIGEPDRLPEKMKWIKKTLEALTKQGKESGVVDVSTATFATYSEMENEE